MIETAEQLRQLVGDYLSGGAPLGTLDEAIAALGERDLADPELAALWGHIELLFAERSAGHADDAEFRADLIALGLVSATATTRTTIGIHQNHDDAATRVHRVVITIAQWLRHAQVSGTPAGTGSASPAGGRA